MYQWEGYKFPNGVVEYETLIKVTNGMQRAGRRLARCTLRWGSGRPREH